MTVRGVDHVSISVSDLASSVRFYHDLLELPLLGRGEEESPEIAAALKVPRARFAYADLDLGDGCILELLRYLEPVGHPVERRLPDPGLGHFGVRVSDLEGTLERLRNAGHATPFSPVTLDAPAWWAGARVVYVTDPDGVVLELVQRSS